MQNHRIYVGRTPCGCVQLKTLPDPTHPAAVPREVEKAILRGLDVSLVPAAEALTPWGPGCPQCRPALRLREVARCAD